MSLIEEREIEELAREIIKLHESLKEFSEKELGLRTELKHSLEDKDKIRLCFSIEAGDIVEIWPNPFTIELKYPDKIAYFTACFPFIKISDHEEIPAHEAREVAEIFYRVAGWAERANMESIFRKFEELGVKARKMAAELIAAQKEYFSMLPEAEIIYQGPAEVKRVKIVKEWSRTILYEIRYMGELIETRAVPGDPKKIARALKKRGIPRAEIARVTSAILDDYNKLDKSMSQLDVIFLVY